MLIHAKPLSEIGDDSARSKHSIRGRWGDRLAGYATQARYDYAMYLWLARHGLMPKPGRVPSARAMRAWHASREYRVLAAGDGANANANITTAPHRRRRTRPAK